MANVITVRAPIELLTLLDRHSASRPDRPTRAALLREYAMRGILAWEREQVLLAREERIERARVARAESRAKRERSEAARLERERERAARKAERAAVPTWNAPPPTP